MESYISPWPTGQNVPDFPRNISLLGCTGSIGTSALAVIAEHPELFYVKSLGAGRNAKLLAQQANTFRPELLIVLDETTAKETKSLLASGYTPEILVGPEGYVTAATASDVDTVLSAIVGAAGFMPTLAAAEHGKNIALANKESLVLGGHLIRKACHKSGAVILPVDSEHNALFQGLAAHEGQDMHKLILTASGGPFRGKDKKFLESVTLEQALNHPNWDMGAKITIDSSTLMNKGLEVIEACHLYGIGVEQIEVVVHPQSIIHSLVEYIDGSQLAHLGLPDMQIPIAYCITYPKRVPLPLNRLNLAEVGTLTFEAPDENAFPCLRLAKEAFAASQSHPIVLNAANEIAVAKFLNKEIQYLDIPAIIERALDAHTSIIPESADTILQLDQEIRKEVASYL
ncbi:MAG: 1-deoxy-D-xylulose-5-phosphate reductoisomerase [Desulfovibrio sp.]